MIGFTILMDKLNSMIENKEIQSLEFKYDEENNVMDIYIVPVNTIEHVTVNIIVTPTGVEFKDN